VATAIQEKDIRGVFSWLRGIIAEVYMHSARGVLSWYKASSISTHAIQLPIRLPTGAYRVTKWEPIW